MAKRYQSKIEVVQNIIACLDAYVNKLLNEGAVEEDFIQSYVNHTQRYEKRRKMEDALTKVTLMYDTLGELCIHQREMVVALIKRRIISRDCV